jgi:diguanylate cyclase (GGDEF)-like protein
VSFDDRRLAAIAHLGLLERSGDPGLTALTRLVGYVTGAAAAAIHVLDDTEQHRVAATGAPLGSHPREDAMCRLVVDGRERIVCDDAAADPRFSYSSFVQGPAPVRFFASAPLELSDGTVVGTLCAWDTEPRELSAEQVERLQDLAEQASARIELVHLARTLGNAAAHDPLTGVVNRLLVFDRLAQAFARRRRHGGHVAVALIDVDDFKAVNDRHGHDTGDEILRAVAQRLSACTRTEDTVARLGGDEFVVVAEVEGGEDDAARLLQRIEDALAGAVTIGDLVLPLSATAGVAIAEAGDDPRSALARADLVMYQRKRSRPPRFR